MFRPIAFLALTGALATTAAADVVNPLVPGWAGNPGTYTATFNNEAAPFTQPYFDYSNPASQAPNTSDLGFAGPILFQFNDAFLTSTGNIYSFSSPLDVHVYGNGTVGQAVLNISALGNPIDYSNVRMFVAGDEEEQYAQQFGTVQEQPTGGGVATGAFAFDWIGFDEFEITNWGFFFGSEQSSCSLTGVQVAINTIPAPGALLALGLVGVARRRRS